MPCLQPQEAPTNRSGIWSSLQFILCVSFSVSLDFSYHSSMKESYLEAQFRFQTNQLRPLLSLVPKCCSVAVIKFRISLNIKYLVFILYST